MFDAIQGTQLYNFTVFIIKKQFCFISNTTRGWKKVKLVVRAHIKQTILLLLSNKLVGYTHNNGKLMVFGFITFVGKQEFSVLSSFVNM